SPAARMKKLRKRSIGDQLFGSSGWKMKPRFIDRHIGLGFINNDLLLIRVALSTRLNRGRNKNAADFFVVASIGLDLLMCSVLGPLRQNANLQKMIRLVLNK